MLVTVRRGKTNPEGETKDMRFVKGDVADALWTLRAAASPGPEDRVVPALIADGGAAVPGVGAGGGRRGAGDRPLGACRAGVGADAAGRVDDRRDAGRELEDKPDGGALPNLAAGGLPAIPSPSIGFDLRC